MKPTLTLIKALRSVADKLERGEIAYRWAVDTDCNCGVLAQELLGKTDEQLEILFNDHDRPELIPGHWYWKANRSRCSKTGLPLNEVFATLLDAGLEWEDFGIIENLSDFDADNRTDKATVIQYFRFKADLLEKQRLAMLPVHVKQ